MSVWDEPNCVYALLDSGRIVYIGCSCNPEQRFQMHRWSRNLPPTVTMRVLRWYKRLGTASKWEGYYIEKFQPDWNIVGKRLIRTKARKIWMNRRLTKREALERMPGWTAYAAKWALGNHTWL